MAIISEKASPLTRPRIRVPKLAHVVAERLRTMIVSGELKEGSRLPPETELLTEYRVSRPTLREALRVLESESLIAVGRGVRSGAVVLGPSIQRVAKYGTLVLVANGATLSDLDETRLLLEPAVVRELADRSNRKSVVEALRKCVADQNTAFETDHFEEALGANLRFHETLVQSSGNQVLILIVGMLHSISAQSYAAVLEGANRSDNRAVHNNMEKSITGHRAIVELISQGKAAEAEAFWRRYMQRSHEFIVKTGLGARKIKQDLSGE
jgi:GntR family transcriptional repressor for pyruvate dehydrogenase complex